MAARSNSFGAYVQATANTTGVSRSVSASSAGNASVQLLPSTEGSSGPSFIIGYAGLGPVTIAGVVRLVNNSRKQKFYTAVDVELRGVMRTQFYVPVYPYFYADSRVASRKVKLVPAEQQQSSSSQRPLTSFITNRLDEKFVAVNPGQYKDIPFFVMFTAPEARALRPTLECFPQIDPAASSKNRNSTRMSASSSTSTGGLSRTNALSDDEAHVRYTLQARVTFQNTPPTHRGRFSFFNSISSIMQNGTDESTATLIMKRWDIAVVKQLIQAVEPHTWCDKTDDVNYSISVDRTIAKPFGTILFTFDVSTTARSSKTLWVESVRFIVQEAEVIKGVGTETSEKMQIDRVKNAAIWEARSQSQDNPLKAQEVLISLPGPPYYLSVSPGHPPPPVLNQSGRFGIIEIQHTIKVVITLRQRRKNFSGEVNSGLPFGTSPPTPSTTPSRFSAFFPDEPTEIELSVPLLVVPYDEDECRSLAEEYPELVWGTSGPGGVTRGGTLPRYSPIQIPEPVVQPDTRRFTFYQE